MKSSQSVRHLTRGGDHAVYPYGVVLCIGVQIASPEGVRVLAEILKQHGGHSMSYFSVGSVQHLS